MSEPITHQVETDILVIGGGTGGPMAAIKAKEKNPSADRGCRLSSLDFWPGN